MDLNKRGFGLDTSGIGQGPVAGCCEQGNEPSLDQRSDYKCLHNGLICSVTRLARLTSQQQIHICN